MKKKIVDAAKILLKNKFPRQWMAYAKWRRGYIEPEQRWVSKLITREKPSVDVGANIGEYTWLLAKLTPYVHAFEPSKELAQLLARASPQNVIVHNIALSDHAGSALLRTPVDNDRKSYGLASLETLIGYSKLLSETVTIARLDDVVHDDIGFIKIDVEGHEMPVLRGATELISRCRPTMLIECEERHRPGATAELFEFFKPLNYVCRFVRNGSMFDIVEFNHLRDHVKGKSDPYIYNFFLLPRERARQF